MPSGTDGHKEEQEGSSLYQGDGLSRAQRLKNARTVRQKQLREYYEFEKREEEKRGSLKRFSHSQNKKGRNVLFHQSLLLQDAVERSDVTEVVSLLDQGADPNTSSVSGVTVLHQCCMEDNLRTAQILISRGADVNAQDDDHWTPLHTACACECAELVQLLLANGADVQVLDVDGSLALDLCPKESEARTVIKQYMNEIGFDDASVKGLKESESLRMLAEVNDFLLNGGYVNSHNDEQVTLLHMAAANNYIEVGRLLAQKGAEVNIQDDEGMTPLHLASKFGHAGMVQLLIALNANPEEQDNNGLSPADVAASDSIEEMLKIACQTYDASKRTSVILEEVFPGKMEEDQQEIIYRKVNKEPLAKTEAYYEAETRLPPDGREEHLPMIDECREDIEVLFPVQSEETYLPSPNPTDNLSHLAELTENGILQELILRYSRDIVYTYIGDILISVNPFKMLPMYTSKASEMYTNLTDRSKLTPHIFAIADRAYQSFLWEKRSQCCIISGESGAGKTETAKYFVQHLLARASSGEGEMNDKIQQVSPLLEVFGNAQTIMNDNSSRFGKFVELLLLENGSVAGACITEYLLEKSRVTHQGEGERNFHIFYLLFNGLDKRQKDRLGLKHPQDHRYLKKGDLTKLNGPEVCGNRFRAVQSCLQYVGFSREDEECLWSILAAIILLGDMKFVSNPDVEGAVMIRKEEQSLQDKVSDLLQVNAEELTACITSDTIITRGEEFRKYRNKFQAEDCRDALSKALYSRLFSWVVNNINQLLRPMEEHSYLNEIGVLDIFGFENFHKNSFEQICINLANENLQGFFNEHIFQREKADCELEGIDTSAFTFTSNDQIIRVFQEKNRGIIDLLNEESHFPRGSDQSLANKLHQGPGTWGKSVYFAPRNGGTTFSIVHYAGIVSYSLEGVVEKNRDTMAKSLIHCMRCSQNRVIREMFTSKLTRKGSIAPSLRQSELKKKPSIDYGTSQGSNMPFRRFKNLSGRRSRKRNRPSPASNKRGQATVAYHFKNSLGDLMEKMNQSNPHFVRCIKPNTAKLSDKFTPEYVIAQLRYTGIMETTKIRRDGFPLRLTAHQFMERFGAMVLLAPSKIYTNSPQKCQEALTYYGMRNFKIGKTKLFFKHYHTEKLQMINYELVYKVIICQKVVKGFLARQKTKLKLAIMKQETQTISDFLDHMERWMEFIYEAQKDKSEHDENRHMEETLRAVAEDEENNPSVDADGTHADATLQPDDLYEYTNPPAGDELSMKESTISSLSNLSSNLNDLDLPDSASEGTIQAPSGTNPEIQTYVYMNDLTAGAAEQSTPITAEEQGPFSESKELGPPSKAPETKTEELNQEYVPMTFQGETGMVDNGNLPPPPPPVMDEVIANEEVEFPPAPPAPPMSDVSDAVKKTIANRREIFLEAEKEAKRRAEEESQLVRPRIKQHVQPFVVQSNNVSHDSPHNGVHSPKRLPSVGVDSPHLGNEKRSYYQNDTNIQGSVNGMNSAPEWKVSRKRPSAPKRAESTRLSALSQTSNDSNEYEKYDDVIGVAIPPPPPYPAPVPPSHYTNRQTVSLHRNIPPPPDMHPPPPPIPSSQHTAASDIYEDELDHSQFQHSEGPYDYIDPTTPVPPPPPPNHPSTLRNARPLNVGPPPPPAPPPPPGPPAPPASSLAKQLGGVKLNRKQVNQRVSAPPQMENQLDQMMREIKEKQLKKRASEISEPCYEVDDISMPQVTKSPPPTSPKPTGRFSAGPQSPPPTRPKPNSNTNPMKGPAQHQGVSKPSVEKDGGGAPSTVDESIPAWKRNMKEKKRKEEEAKQKEEEEKKKAEEEKWKGIPEWKRKIMEAKEQKKAADQADKMKEDKERLELEAKLAEMPEWKRKVYMKKHGLDKNGDENGNSDPTSSVS